jgi:hypothetical protein
MQGFPSCEGFNDVAILILGVDVEVRCHVRLHPLSV